MNKRDRIIRHLVKIDSKFEKQQIKNVDYIYLINLDRRPERLTRCIDQLVPYDIRPHRVSAVYGWDLPQETFDDIGITVRPSMFFDRPLYFSPLPRDIAGEFITAAKVGKTCVHDTMTAGALGCTLSHLSVLFDAYQAGYDTIWVLEDDFTAIKSPHLLGEYVEKLNTLVGPSEWDLFYTDNDSHLSISVLFEVLRGGRLGRPGIPVTRKLEEYHVVGPDFVKIGSRGQTHSMVIHKSGISKILNFLLNNGIFLPYDMELAFIPDIKLYNLLNEVVHGRDRTGSESCYKLP